MKKKINIYIRKKTNDKYSIENVFEPLINEFRISYDFIVEKIELPFTNKGILNKFKNIKFVLAQTADIHHISGDIHYISLALALKRIIITVHDLNFVRSKYSLKNFFFKIFWIYFPFILSKNIVAISEETKKQISSYYSGFGSKTLVIPNFVREEYLLAKSNIRERSTNTVMHIGTKENKNLERLIVALSDLEVQLIVVGKLSDCQKTLLFDYKITYQEQTNLSIDQLTNLYTTSSVLHFCSLNEGFGLPILEAQSTGLPVITSNISPMKEIAGIGAILVNPNKANEIRQAIITLLRNESLRKSIVGEGYRNAEKYTLAKVAEQYLNLYRNIFR